MDFIERLFGVAPDGGTGSLELLFFLVPIVAIVVLRWTQYRVRRKKALHHGKHR